MSLLLFAKKKFNPRAWFAKGEPGAWYDPSDISINWRRNLLTYTEDFSNATVWVPVSASATKPTVTPNYGVAPDGTSTACRLQADRTSIAYSLLRQLTSGMVTASIWAKSNTGSSQAVIFSDYNTPTELITVTTDWQRFSKTGLTNTIFDIGTRNIGGSDAVIDILIWHPQAEKSSTPSEYQKITDGVQDYYTVQPQPVLFQDSAGTIPITYIEQPVGLMLDKSKGLALGAERVINGTFDTDTGWTKGVGWTITGGQGVLTAGAGILQQAMGAVVVGTSYTVSINTNLAIQLRVGSANIGYFNPVNNTILCFIQAIAGTLIEIIPNGTQTGYIDNISVKQIAGNHAFQATSGNKPLLSARVNLLTKTESIASSPWALRSTGTIVATDNYAIAPNGTMTATLLNKTSTVIAQWQQSFASVVGTIYIGTVFIQKTLTNNVVEVAVRGGYTTTSSELYGNIDTKTGLTYIRFGPGTVSAKSVGDYWAFSVLPTNVSAGTLADAVIQIIPSVGTILGTPDFTATGSCVVWGADLRPTNSGALLPAYQRVTTASDYDTVGFPLYLACNGTVSSRSMSTNSIDFTSTDKMTVVTGVRKLSDAANANVFEMGNTLPAGGFNLYAPNTVSSPSYSSYVNAGTVSLINSSSSYPAPIGNVISMLLNTSAASPNQQFLRINAVSSGTQSATLSGNFTNIPLYLFSRAGTTSFLNGNFYGAIIRGAQSDTASVVQTENYMATKTGITF